MLALFLVCNVNLSYSCRCLTMAIYSSAEAGAQLCQSPLTGIASAAISALDTARYGTRFSLDAAYQNLQRDMLVLHDNNIRRVVRQCTSLCTFRAQVRIEFRPCCLLLRFGLKAIPEQCTCFNARRLGCSSLEAVWSQAGPSVHSSCG